MNKVDLTLATFECMKLKTCVVYMGYFFFLWSEVSTVCLFLSFALCFTFSLCLLCSSSAPLYVSHTEQSKAGTLLAEERRGR